MLLICTNKHKKATIEMQALSLNYQSHLKDEPHNYLHFVEVKLVGIKKGQEYLFLDLANFLFL